MYTISKQLLLIIGVSLILTSTAFSQPVNFSDAKIYCPEKKNKIVLKAVNVFLEEVAKRSDIKLKTTKKLKATSEGIIIVGIEKNLDKLPEKFQQVISKMPTTGKEGYKILSINDSKSILVIGNDARGALYGIGKLLRKMEIRKGEVLVPDNLNISSTPEYPIRGHQLGYRPKTNSYDAWTPEMFDSYIRDLAIFGANSIEIMPPRTDDDFTSVHMKTPAIEMIVEQAKSCDSYGMDVWMWYPNLADDYTDPETIKKEIKEREEVFSVLPRLDAVFVPGGDPGELEPDILFEWLKKEAEILHKYHPNAKIWVSPQTFRPTKDWYDSFYTHVNREYKWFGGVVFGPWVKTPIEEIREIVNPGIPIRRYPDITHSTSCQYPIPKWDLALASTLARESMNPRPNDQKMIHNVFAGYGDGSISYSEGTNDDLNKIIWSDQDWDSNTPVIETLRDYARYFIGPDYTEGVANGFMSQEKNLQGPLLVNDGTIRTFQQWKDIESSASSEVLSNFRFQMGLIRAYYDAYIYHRLIYETELEQKAREILEHADEKGSKKAIIEARETLSKAWKEPVSQELKDRCYSLADSLYRSIGAQLTVEKHTARDGRGNFIDYIDLPLNDACWILDMLAAAEKIQDETRRLEAIDSLLNRTNPGPGGFYDNFGSPKSWDRVKSDVPYTEDPGTLASPRVSFGVRVKGKEWVHKITSTEYSGKASPRAWMNQVTTLYDQPLEIVYKNLDPNSSYTIKVAYTGRFRSNMKLVVDNDYLVHDYIKTGEQPIYEFPIPKEALADGMVEFKWTCVKGGRGSQVAEIWIIRN